MLQNVSKFTGAILAIYHFHIFHYTWTKCIGIFAWDAYILMRVHMNSLISVYLWANTPITQHRLHCSSQYETFRIFSTFFLCVSSSTIVNRKWIKVKDCIKWWFISILDWETRHPYCDVDFSSNSKMNYLIQMNWNWIQCNSLFVWLELYIYLFTRRLWNKIKWNSAFAKL